VNPAETAVAKERLCKHTLLGNRFLTRNNRVTGKRCSLRGPLDSYVTQHKRTGWGHVFYAVCAEGILGAAAITRAS
jgi:hypothetical protein